jgi:Na+/H+ antiporter NhaC
MSEPRELTFRGGWLMAFVPVAVFLFFCLLFFVILQAFEMQALAMGGFVALLLGALLATNYRHYWDAVMRGISSSTAVTIVVILLVIGMFAQLIKTTNVSDGFVWLAHEIGVGAGLFTFFTFIVVCTIAMATGSSIGTMFTTFPIFYPAGVALGADPALLAGAIVSGGIFGDNLAPISDTTIISAASQRFRRRSGVADIGGVVAARAKYALVAAGLAGLVYLLLGGGSGGNASGALPEDASPRSLIMLVPVALTLVVAFLTRDIFKAVTVGLVLGTIIALVSGLITFDGVVGVVDGTPVGFLVEGVTYMFSTVALVIAVFGIVGVLTEARVLQRLVDRLARSRMAATPRGAEASIAVGSVAAGGLFGGVTSASMLAFGPVADQIGARVNLHPYRRSNVMDCFTLGIGGVIPFMSAYLLIGTLLSTGYDNLEPISIQTMFVSTLYPLALTAVMVFAVVTGWGRRFEGAGGVAATRPDPAAVEAEPEPATSS